MQIDSHQRLWRYAAVRDSWITDEMIVLRRDFLPERLAPEPNANGIGATVAARADQSEDETSIAWPVGWIGARRIFLSWDSHDAFGADRPMFGSDGPVRLRAGSYDRVRRLVARCRSAV